VQYLPTDLPTDEPLQQWVDDDGSCRVCVCVCVCALNFSPPEERGLDGDRIPFTCFSFTGTGVEMGGSVRARYLWLSGVMIIVAASFKSTCEEFLMFFIFFIFYNSVP